MTAIKVISEPRVVQVTSDDPPVIQVKSDVRQIIQVIGTGPQGPRGYPGDFSMEEILAQTYAVWTQSSPAAVWEITHELGKNPSVTVVDSAGTMCFGEVDYPDAAHILITFTAPFAGQAFLN